ncbi:MAG: hypothetical protein Q8S13_14870, partial [Dehalococcoidia bacterium]|nr:hypothetical protein [Dehalococcoidia bacterium]
RRSALSILAFVSALIGMVGVFGLVTGEAPAVGVASLPFIPLALAVFYVLSKERDASTDLAGFARGALVWLVIVAIGVAILVGATALAMLAGARSIVVVIGALPLVVVALGLALVPVNWLLALWARLRGGPQRAFGICFYAALRWQPLSREDGETEWDKAHVSLQGRTLTGAWRSTATQTLRIEYRDTNGRRYMLMGNVHKKPWMAWLAGIFLRASSDASGRTATVSMRIFERVDCAWRRLPLEELRAELANLGDADRRPSQGWRCRDCGALRIDLVDAEGRDVLLMTDLPEGPEPLWYGGAFFAFGKAPRLASDLSVSPPPAIQPS